MTLTRDAASLDSANISFFHSVLNESGKRIVIDTIFVAKLLRALSKADEGIMYAPPIVVLHLSTFRLNLCGQRDTSLRPLRV